MNIKKFFTLKIAANLFVGLMVVVLGSIFLVATPALADDSVAHCEELFPEQNFDNDQYKACVAAISNQGEGSGEQTIDDFGQNELSVTDENTIANVKANPIYDLLLTFINFLTAGVGLVVTTMVVVGGIQYMTAQGNPQKTQVAILRITNAFIGLVLYIFMFAILQWLIPGGLFG